MDKQGVELTEFTKLKRDLHGYDDSEGYLAEVNTHEAQTQHVKTTKDGHIVLIPQPSDSPQDTLNLSKAKKHVVLLVVSFAALLPDYGSATGAVTLIPQAA